MDTSTESFVKLLFRGLAWLLFVIGGFSFLVGGRLISEFWKTDRILAEMIGLGIAAACAAVGYGLKNAGEPDDVKEDPD
jgi:hypothetical protein